MSTGARPLRRRAKRSFGARVRPFWILALASIAIVATGLFEFVRWPGFEPRRVEVAGNTLVSRSDILSAAAIDERHNIWLADRGAIARRIEAIPYVQTARISVLPPAHVTIAVVERVPAGCLLAADGSRAIIDAELRVLEADCGRKQAPMYHLPALAVLPAAGHFIESPVLRHELDANASLAAFGPQYNYFDVDEFGELVALRSDGIFVKFGSFERLPEKARVVEAILATVHGRFRSVRSVDVRTPGTPVIEYR